MRVMGHEISRRDVLGAAAGVTGLTVLGAMGGTMGGCGMIVPKQEEKPPAVTTGVVNIGAGSEYRAGTATGKFFVMYGFIVSNDAGTVVAVRPRCTHKGCLAAYSPAKTSFVCPCHDSEFNLIGSVIKGPAVRSMPMVVAAKQTDGTLTVDLDKLYAAEAALHVVPVKKG